LPDLFSDHRRLRAQRASAPGLASASGFGEIVPASAGGINKTSTQFYYLNWKKANPSPDWDLEIRKRYAQPLALESGEFPDTTNIESRMLPICYESGLTSGHVQDAAYFMSVATETFIKEVLSAVFSKTRSNGPGTTGSAGTGGGATWIQSHRYRAQLEREEEAFLRGEVQRDKNGLLPIEARAASERGPLGMADFRTALEVNDCHLGQMPVVVQQIMFGYREGELDAWDNYSWPENHAVVKDVGQGPDVDVEMGGANGANGINGVNGINGHSLDMEVDDWGWEGGDPEDKRSLDTLLDSCLAIGS
jgi:transcriptional coactivator HFI1/ADA1